MGNIGELTKLGRHHFGIGFLIFAAILGPGFLTIYEFKRDYLKDLDFAKLIIFSISLTAPVLILVFALSLIGFDAEIERDGAFEIAICLGSSFAMHLSLIAAHFLSLQFPLYVLFLALVCVLVSRFICFTFNGPKGK